MTAKKGRAAKDAGDQPARAAVLGWPVSHSLSPRLHGYWLRELGINGTYRAIAVEPEKFTDKLRALAAEGYKGFNVTVPHKEAALMAADEVDAEARRIGAVNTIVIGRDGRLRGSNTDGYGFIENLRANPAGLDAAAIIAGGPAVVLGAGGAARSVVAALDGAGAPEIRLVNRTAAKARALADDIHREKGAAISILSWPERETALIGASLLVNTTVLGMTGRPALEIDLDNLPPGALVTDIVYTPLITPLLAAAAERGNPVVDGLGMLIHQARPGFNAWFGAWPEITPGLREDILAAC